MANTQNIPSGWFDVTDARHPRWSDASRRTITLDVLFGWCRESGTYIPFTASPDDGEAHGRQLFADAKAGEYGEVAPGKWRLMGAVSGSGASGGSTSIWLRIY